MLIGGIVPVGAVVPGACVVPTSVVPLPALALVVPAGAVVVALPIWRLRIMLSMSSSSTPPLWCTVTRPLSMPVTKLRNLSTNLRLAAEKVKRR